LKIAFLQNAATFQQRGQDRDYSRLLLEHLKDKPVFCRGHEFSSEVGKCALSYPHGREAVTGIRTVHKSSGSGVVRATFGDSTKAGRVQAPVRSESEQARAKAED